MRVVDRSGSELGRGLVAYPADEARSIAGQRSDAIEDILGYRGRDELIHRDDLALLKEGAEMIAVEKDAAGDLRQQMMRLGAAAQEAARELARVNSGSLELLRKAGRPVPA